MRKPVDLQAMTKEDLIAEVKALRRHALAVEHAAEAVIITNDAWEIDYVNPTFTVMTGYTDEDIMGKDLRILRDPKAGAAVYDTVREHLCVTGGWTGGLGIRRKDGSVFQAETFCSQFRNSDGQSGNYVLILHDISERLRLEEKLCQAQKIQAIGTLAGGVAHDFNNILAAIIGFSELALDKVPRDSPARHHVTRTLEAAIRGRDLVRQILAFARRSEADKKPLQLSVIIKETLKLLRASLPSTIDIRLNVTSESGPVIGDPAQMQQVIINLCTNAAHAMRARGGTITIDLSDFSFSQAAKAPHPRLSPGRYLRLSIKDTGEGMPKEILERIFDPFFTTKRAGEGTGLGLSVVLGIVESNAGAIVAVSEPGQGATFTVYLPQLVAAQPAAAEMVQPIPTGHERILLIDDEEPLVEMGQDILTELGYQVAATTRSREALDLLKKDPNRFDLVITDQTMPDMTGIELAKEILMIRSDIPIILSTGFSHLVDADSAKAAGIKAFVMKPLTKREIARTIRDALEG